VILVDANILIYAHVSSFAQHPSARGWLDQQLNGSGPVGLPWPSIVAFLRLVTNPRIFEHPESVGDAWRQVHAWPACETTWVPQPTQRHAELLGEFLGLPGVHGNLVPDAHWRYWLWNTGLRCAPQTAILRGFAACVGSTRLLRLDGQVHLLPRSPTRSPSSRPIAKRARAAGSATGVRRTSWPILGISISRPLGIDFGGPGQHHLLAAARDTRAKRAITTDYRSAASRMERRR
jgi:toxin-antitoxin system PIN domain toxin